MLRRCGTRRYQPHLILFSSLCYLRRPRPRLEEGLGAVGAENRMRDLSHSPSVFLTLLTSRLALAEPEEELSSVELRVENAVVKL